ncbi:T9SS type A sorting domain-containing protein [Owenweeksia hongkongensis]|uniref:T9SS type A sorting domain-containing protein n=1 Tax=Owenweeksia hongkongensis TaxID=253245 RepID=UPI003A8F3952
MKTRQIITGLAIMTFAFTGTLKAQTWSTMSNGLDQNSYMRTITATDGSNLYVADFDNLGLGELKVRMWDGSSWSNLPNVSGVSGSWYNEFADIAVYNGEVYVAMLWQDYMLKFNGTSWSKLILPPRVSGSRCRSLEVHNGELIIGGRFHLSDGTANYDNVMKYDGVNFTAMPGLSNVVHDVTDIHVMNGEIYCQAGRVYKWNGSTWNAWGAVPTPQGSIDRGHLMSYNNELYYSGYKDGTFHKIDSNTATLVTTLPFKLQDMDVYNGELYLVGDSTITGTGTWPYSIGGGLVKYDGQNFTTLSAPSAIRTGVVYNGELCYFSSTTSMYNGIQYDRAFRMSSVLSTGEFLEKQTSLSVYPNPAHGLFYIENSLNEKQEVELIDATGKVIRNISLQPEMKAEVGTESLAPGMYFINNGSNTHRVIITP